MNLKWAWKIVIKKIRTQHLTSLFKERMMKRLKYICMFW